MDNGEPGQRPPGGNPPGSANMPPEDAEARERRMGLDQPRREPRQPGGGENSDNPRPTFRDGQPGRDNEQDWPTPELYDGQPRPMPIGERPEGNGMVGRRHGRFHPCSVEFNNGTIFFNRSCPGNDTCSRGPFSVEIRGKAGRMYFCKNGEPMPFPKVCY